MVSGAIGAGAAIGSAVFGASQSKKAGKRAKKLARKQAEAERFELEESLRRLDIRNQQATGQQAAAAGATGFDIKSGSIKRFLAEQRDQQRQERDFASTQGQRRIELTRQGGQNAQAAADARATSALVSGFGSAATSAAGGFANLQSARAANPNVKWWQV
jgi:high-affinity K+ transport system ATPase subunit B